MMTTQLLLQVCLWTWWIVAVCSSVHRSNNNNNDNSNNVIEVDLAGLDLGHGAGLSSSSIMGIPQNSIRSEFHRNFEQSCTKYNFVHDYIQRLEQPIHNNKFILFMYHTKTLKNGGFGDRMGGLVTAFAQAMRFNRTLILQASNGMHDLFRPYHPTDILLPIEDQKYTWKQWRTWSQFDSWKASLDIAYDATSSTSRAMYEYDLSGCISNQESGFTEEQTARCAMDDSYTDKPIIRFASNRAYLCRWETHPELPAHREVFTALKLVPKQVDLFEVAGCMLRLLMWPTEQMWREADKGYDLLLRELKSSIVANATASAAPSTTTTTTTADDEVIDEEEDGEITAKKKKKKGKKKKDKKTAGKTDKSSQKKKTKKKTKAKAKAKTSQRTADTAVASSKKLTKSEQRVLAQIDSFLAANDSQRTPFTLRPHPPLLVGLHFRCGDRWSYFKLKLHTDGHDPNACVVDAPDVIGGELGLDEGQKSQYHRAGNPASIGDCAKHIVAYHNAVKASGKDVTGYGGIEEDTGFFRLPQEHYRKNSTAVVFVTSDNVFAEEQMRTFVGHPLTVISPQGCHIELDPSRECYTFTTTYWFLLALNDIILSQTFGEVNAPTSSFSRYAGIYGLKAGNPFRSGRYCGDFVHSWKTLSRFQQGNWLCDITK